VAFTKFQFCLNLSKTEKLQTFANVEGIKLFANILLLWYNI